jgi:hypothetical protein
MKALLRTNDELTLFLLRVALAILPFTVLASEVPPGERVDRFPKSILNFDFVDGTRGGHVSISGVSGIATKTSFATFLLHSIFKGRKAPANPWGGRSLEWQCASPPPHDNFPEAPTVGDCYDFSVLEWNEAEQGYRWRADVPRPGEESPRH